MVDDDYADPDPEPAGLWADVVLIPLACLLCWLVAVAPK